MKKKLRVLLIILFAIIFLFSAWKVFHILKTYWDGRTAYNDLEQFVFFEDTEEESETEDEAETAESDDSELPDVSAWPQVDFDELAQINPDIVGWLYIEGTDINYPVVQGDDNDYYLKHVFDGTENKTGCIFLDYRCTPDFSDRHSILYGHHRIDESMFGDLMNYKDQTFYDEYPDALLVAPDAYYRVRFFSAFVTDNWSNAWDLNLNDMDHEAWLEEMQEKSCLETDYAPALQDRIVTLSTCSYEFENAKFVLHGYICEVIDKSIFEEEADR